MSIFDAFSFKKEAGQIFTKGNFKLVLEIARTEIVRCAKLNIPGQDKKEKVDEIVIAKIRELRNKCKNKLVLWVIEQIIKIIPTVTQLVYDFLKEKVENL